MLKQAWGYRVFGIHVSQLLIYTQRICSPPSEIIIFSYIIIQYNAFSQPGIMASTLSKCRRLHPTHLNFIDFFGEGEYFKQYYLNFIKQVKYNWLVILWLVGAYLCLLGVSWKNVREADQNILGTVCEFHPQHGFHWIVSKTKSMR